MQPVREIIPIIRLPKGEVEKEMVKTVEISQSKRILKRKVKTGEMEKEKAKVKAKVRKSGDKPRGVNQKNIQNQNLKGGLTFPLQRKRN